MLKERASPLDIGKAISLSVQSCGKTIHCHHDCLVTTLFSRNVEIAVEEHIRIYKENEELRRQKEELEKTSELQRKRIEELETELDYTPGNRGYTETKEHYESLVKQQVK